MTMCKYWISSVLFCIWFLFKYIINLLTSTLWWNYSSVSVYQCPFNIFNLIPAWWNASLHAHLLSEKFRREVTRYCVTANHSPVIFPNLKIWLQKAFLMKPAPQNKDKCFFQSSHYKLFLPFLCVCTLVIFRTTEVSVNFSFLVFVVETLSAQLELQNY